MNVEQVEYEEKLGHAMVKGHLISDNQLRTALDYQRSVGGALGDVLVKLGFLRDAALKEFLTKENLTPPPPSSSPPPVALLDAASLTPVPEKRRSRRELPLEPIPGVTESDPNRPRWGLEELAQLAFPPADPVLRALIRLLVKKGVVTAEEEEQILLAGPTSAPAIPTAST